MYDLLRQVTYYGYYMSEEHFASGVTVGPVQTAAGIVAVLYFWYSFFLAARLRYGASRFEALVVTAFAVVAPVTSITGWAALNRAVRSSSLDLPFDFYVVLFGPLLALVAFDLVRRNT